MSVIRSGLTNGLIFTRPGIFTTEDTVMSDSIDEASSQAARRKIQCSICNTPMSGWLQSDQPHAMVICGKCIRESQASGKDGKAEPESDE